MNALIWVVLLIVFAIMEGMTAGLVSIWFCCGSAVALVVTFLGGSILVQTGLFFVVSVACMAVMRPLAKKYITPKTERTNADRILGQEGIVMEEINNRTYTGQIKVGGAVWTARADKEEYVIPAGAEVRVLRIEGVKAIVEPKP